MPPPIFNTHFLLLYLLCLRCLHVRQHVSKALPQKAQLKIPQETCLELCLFKITYHYRVNSMRSKCTLLGTCYLDSCDMQSQMQEHFTENSSSSARGWSKTISSVFLLGITGITMLTDKYLTSTAKWITYYWTLHNVKLMWLLSSLSLQSKTDATV